MAWPRRFPGGTSLVAAWLTGEPYTELPISGDHTIALDGLPSLHKDPFDRILIAQAMVEGITLLTGDPFVAQYPGPARRV